MSPFAGPFQKFACCVTALPDGARERPRRHIHLGALGTVTEHVAKRSALILGSLGRLSNRSEKYEEGLQVN
jgi:hypothetical protein